MKNSGAAYVFHPTQTKLAFSERYLAVDNSIGGAPRRGPLWASGGQPSRPPRQRAETGIGRTSALGQKQTCAVTSRSLHRDFKFFDYVGGTHFSFGSKAGVSARRSPWS